MVSNNHELADYISDHLPISTEDALDFIEGVLNGCLFNDRINFALALGKRDRIIHSLHKEIAQQLSGSKKFTETLDWLKQMFDDEWTYEPGTGEVVEEIIQRFEQIDFDKTGIL